MSGLDDAERAGAGGNNVLSFPLPGELDAGRQTRNLGVKGSYAWSGREWLTRLGEKSAVYLEATNQYHGRE